MIESQGAEAVKRMRMLDDKKQRLSIKNEEYSELAQKRAEAERNYHIAYRQEMLKLKTKGEAATTMKELVRGVRAVADLKFEFDVASAIEKACLESLRNIREGIGADRSILTWLRQEKTNP
jgi:phosphopantetheine adenylyltransferase